MRHVVISGLVGFLMTTALPAAVHACDCETPEVNAAKEASTAIFEGRVDSLETSGDQVRADLAVVRTWKGVEQERIAVSAGEGACRFVFKAHTSYLIYARRDESGALTVSQCLRTQPIEYAEEDLAVLGAGVVPVDPAPTDGRSLLPTPPEGPVTHAGCASCHVGQERPAPHTLALLILLALTRVATRRRARD